MSLNGTQRLRGFTALVLLGILALPAVVLAQANGERHSTRDGVYSESQARKGAETFRKNCAECHAPRSHAGTAFRHAWSGRPLFELYDLIRRTMPSDKPGGLSRGQYAEIVAYMLRLNGLPAGQRALPTDEDALRAILIEIGDPTPP